MFAMRNSALILMLFKSFHLVVTLRNIIIDTDGGADDIMAILTAINSPGDTNIVAIITGCGNANATQAAINVLKALIETNRTDIPVYRGSESYYMSFNDLSSNYFGEDAFGDFDFKNPPSPDQIQKEHGVMALIRLTKQYEGTLSLLCLGPLTNMALSIKLYPNFLQSFQQIFIMGGTLKGNGNISPGTEFNFHRDPDAAQLVFEGSERSNTTLYLLTWDTCVESKFTKYWRSNIFGSMNSPLINFINQAERIGLENSSSKYWYPVDSMAACVLIYPEIIQKIHNYKILILNEGELSKGISVVDQNAKSGKKLVQVIQKIDGKIFQRILTDAFQTDPSRILRLII